MDLQVKDAVEIPVAAAASKSVPSWNFTPCARWKTHVLPPSWTSHEVARSGTTFHSGGGVMVTRELKMLFHTQKVK
jgi:hypothetical protein